MILPRWGGDDGVRSILSTSFPLMLSFAVASANLFLDRIFLSWYSRDAFNAALQAGMLQWTILNLFFQTVGYTATFVAQYIGARDDKDVGSMMWQGVYVSIAGGAIMALLAPLGFPLFRIIGHAGNIPHLEGEYFQMLCRGSVTFLLMNTANSFYAGQNRTMMMLFINIACFILNASFNVWFVFQKVWIFPTGMAGSAFSTIAANGITAALVGLLIFISRENESRFRMRSAWRFNWQHARQLLRYGLPAGVHVMIDLIGFTTFMNVVGVFGSKEQFASNMAMNINLMLFIPAVGLHIGTQILSGKFCGAKDPASVERMTAGSLMVAIIYMVIVCISYIVLPTMMLHGFRGSMTDLEWQPRFELAKLLLLFVAYYSLFDAVALIYGGALKGAGDTKFVMLTSIFFSAVLFVAPCVSLWMMHKYNLIDPHTGLYLCWVFCSITVNFLRFRYGKWKTFDLVGTGVGEGLG
ncbi:MAG: MATE family efflux transporter [Candidatus Sumerlaeota bacterium]